MAANLSVIIPVYNSVEHLHLVLAGFCRQTSMEFELIVADDGSGPEMRTFVRDFARTSPFPLHYVYHSDEGFRRSKILNSAVRESATGYLVFVDGDCIPHRRFVQSHWEHRESRTVLVGRRVNLSERLSQTLTPADVRAGKLERMKLAMFADALLGKGSHWDEGLLIDSSLIRELVERRKPSMLGSVCSLEKPLFEEINGFNEDFVSYGGEDVEMEYRLALAGARFKWVRHQAIQYHLYHKARVVEPGNFELIERTKRLGRAACSKGLRDLETS
jgi:glycosyltransferase involved in cell wall biosynthesis